MSICQTPSKEASRVGRSGIPPKQYHESCFVADVAPALDVEHTISVSGQLVTVCIETTRYVGTVEDGFLVLAQEHIDQHTLAEKLWLTIRATITALEVGGWFGDGLDVEVFLHKGTDRKISLGKLEGRYGVGNNDWQEFELEVDVRCVKFPSDPCPTQSSNESCGREIEPASNEITFEFTGPNLPAFMEVDWLTLEPKDVPGLAWRPVLLVHGLGGTAAMMQAGTAWFDGLQARDVGCHAVDLTPKGSISNNGSEIALAVDDLKRRFGVDRVNVVGHSKGGLDAREYVKKHNDVETLIMLGTPNAGSFIADNILLAIGGSSARPAPLLLADAIGFLEMCSPQMRIYNKSYVRNDNTTYVTAAGAYDSFWAKRTLFAIDGENDEIVSVASVEALPYAEPWTYITSVNDPESQGICLAQNLFNHSCLRYYKVIVYSLFPDYMAVLTPPLRTARAAAFETTSSPDFEAIPARSRRSRAAAIAASGPLRDDVATGTQGVMSEVGTASPSGVTNSHIASIDRIDAAWFLVLVDQDVLRFELVSPTGSRIDATTPLADSSVTYTPFGDAGPLSYAGYYVEGPEAGDWTLEVTGTGVTSSDVVYAVAALAQLTPGTGVVLAARVDRELYAVGGAVTITATITADGLPVTDATVEAFVRHPDGTTTTEVALHDDGTNGDPVQGDGEYTGLFTATTDAGLYAIVVSAERTAPAFTREQLLVVPVAQSSTAFSGTVSDHGADTDGDGLYNQLVLDVEVAVDVEATYRVFGTLTDGAGTTIEQVRAEQELEPGLQTVSLSFDGANLFALGHDGPYVLEDLVLEEVATAIGLGRGPSYTTAAYAHTDFQRPPCLLTQNASDHGVHTDSMGQMPYEALVVEVEVDMLAGADVQVRAKLYSEDGTFVAASSASAVLSPGLNMLEFQFAASDIFRSGKPGPYTLRLLSMWGTTLSGAPDAAANGTPVSLRVPGVVAVTQPYRLEDFEEISPPEPPRYTVGGTVTGLTGSGLDLADHAAFPWVHTLPTSNGAFTFASPKLSGSSYDVRVSRHPMNPIQVCSLTNATGIVGTANITDIAAHCVTPLPEEGLDPSFGSAGKVIADDSPANALAVQSDGKIVVVVGNTLARYHSDGSADVSFGSGGTVSVGFVLAGANSVAIQPDGKIVVAGSTSGSAAGDFALARYTVDGMLDPSFGSGGEVITDFTGFYDQGWTVLIQPDGNIVAAGAATTEQISGGLSADFAVARYVGTGTLDTSFGSGGKVTTDVADNIYFPRAALLQADGKIVVAARVAESGGALSDFGVVRYTADGVLDASFGNNGMVRTDFGLGGWWEPTDLVLQSDGKLVVVGRGGGHFGLARFEATGAPDPSFGSAGLVITEFGTGSAYPNAGAVQLDGKIILAGNAVDATGNFDSFALARYTVDGLLDSSFGSGGKVTVDFFGSGGRAECIAVQADGKIVVGGSAKNAAASDMALVRMLP